MVDCRHICCEPYGTCQLARETYGPCQMGCGRATEDSHGGACKACWAAIDPPGES